MANILSAKVLETNIISPFITPELLQEYDVIMHPISGAQAFGDPLERDPAEVALDLTKGWTRERIASDVHCVVASYDEKTKEWSVDEAATKTKRNEMRQARKERSVPFKEWWAQERERVIAKENMNVAVQDMWRSSMELSPEYGAELRAFWQLPEDFTF